VSLDPDNQQILNMMKAAARPPVHEPQPQEARSMYRASRGALQQSNAPTARQRVMMRRKADTSLLIRWSPADDAPVDKP